MQSFGLIIISIFIYQLQTNNLTEREKAIWKAAITLCHNICAQDSNRINDADGPLEAVHALSDSARRMLGFSEITNEILEEIFN